MKYLKFVGVLIAVLAVIGAYFYPKFSQPLGQSSSGTTFNTAKFAGVSVNLASPGANGTSTSILNGDANDRYVTAVKVGCSGVGTSNTAYTGTGLANLLLTVATSSTAAPATLIGFADVVQNMTIPTTTTRALVASSTSGSNAPAASSSLQAVWPAGAYMTFSTNATNTATCIFGVDYFSS